MAWRHVLQKILLDKCEAKEMIYEENFTAIIYKIVSINPLIHHFNV